MIWSEYKCHNKTAFYAYPVQTHDFIANLEYLQYRSFKDNDSNWNVNIENK